MKKLQFAILLFVLSSCAVAVDVQTSSVAATINDVLSNPGHDKTLQTFVLKDNTTNYTLDSSTLSLPINSAVASNLEFVGPTVVSSATSFEVCDSLPSLTFINIQFDSLETLKFSSLKLIFSSSDNFLNASKTTQILFQSCCIYQQNWDSTLSFKASFSNGSSLRFADSLFFFQSDSPWNMQIGSISHVQFANSVFYYDQKNFTASCSGSYGVSELLFISINLSDSVSIQNITVSSRKSTSEMSFNSIKGLIDTKNTKLISLSDVKIHQLNTSTESCSWFSILNSTNVTLQDISFSNTTVKTQDGKRSIIAIHKVAQTLQASGLKLEDTEFYGISDYTVTDSILFLSEANELIATHILVDRSTLVSTAVLNLGKRSGFGAISAVNIASSVFDYAALYCYIGSLPSTTYSQNNSLSMQNISVMNSKLDGEFVFVNIKSEKEIMDPAMTIQLAFEGIIFNNNTINDSNLFALQNNQLDFNNYAVLELFSVNFSNITYFNNTIGFSYKGNWITEINLFHTIGFAMFLSNINMTLNNLTNTSILTLGKGVCTYVLSDSSIIQNQFTESVITRASKSATSSILPPSFLNIVNNTMYLTLFYRFGIISGNNVSNNTFQSSSAVFYLLQPFRLLDSNHFSSNNLINAAMFYCQSRFQNQFPLLRDKNTENYIFSRLSSRIANLIESTFDDSYSQYTKSMPFLRVTSNNFTDLYIVYAPVFYVLEFETESAFVQIDNNSFQQITSNQSFLLNGYLVGQTIIKSNLFWQITGNKSLIFLTSQNPWSSLEVISNELVECRGIGLISYDSSYSAGVLMQNNTITSNHIGRILISLLLQKWDGKIEFAGNTVKNNEFYCMFSTQLNVFEIQAPRSYEGSAFIMSDNLFEANTFIESRPFVDQVYQNHFMHLGLAKASAHFTNTTFDGLTMQWDGNLIRIASSTISFQQCVFNNILNYDAEGVIMLVTQSLTINATRFDNVTGDVKGTYGSIFNIARDPYFTSSVDVIIQNSLFKNTTSLVGSVLIADKILLNLTANNNAFINNRQLLGAAIYITNSIFERFIFDNFSLSVTDNPTEYTNLNFNFDFIEFKNCSGSASVSNSLMVVSPSDAAIFTIYESSQLEFKLSGVYLTSDETSTALAFDSHIILLKANTGTISFDEVTVMNLINFDLPFIHFDCNTDKLITFSGSKITATGLKLRDFSKFVQWEALGVITITGNQGSLNMTLENSIFNDIWTDYSGGGIANLKALGATLNILNCSFEAVRARNGSAIFFTSGVSLEMGDSSLYINNSVFLQCRSTDTAGGAIYYIATKFGVGKFEIFNSTFDSNSAMVRGGAIYTNYSRAPDFFNRTLANNKFVNNFINLTSQTNDIGGDLIELDLTLTGNLSTLNVVKLDDDTISIWNASVSSFQDLELTFKLLDTFHQDYFDPDPNKVLFIDINGTDYSSIDCSNYSCTIADNKMQLLGVSGSTIQMEVNYKNTYFKTFPIQLRNCTEGEFYYGLSCLPCPPGKYSIDPSQGTCYDCPDNAVCQEGHIVDVLNGYWRGANSMYEGANGVLVPYKANLLKCDPEVNSCLRNNMCVEGYTGPLCAQCDFEKGYVTRGKKCGECPATMYLILQLFGLLAVFLAYQTWFIRHMIQTNRAFYEVIKRGGNYVSSASPYIRLLTTFSQIMTIVSTFNLNLQEFFRIDFSLGSPTATIIYPTTCLLSRTGLPATQVYYWELSIIVLLPILQWGIFALIATRIVWAQRHTTQLSNLLYAIIVGLIMLEQPAIFQSLLKAFTTKKLDPNTDLYYISSNPSVPADKYYYKFITYFALPNLIIWGPGIVFALAFLLFRYRKSFNSERMRLVLGGYINEYREETFYWGLILMCFKLILMTVSNFLRDDPKTKVLLTVLIFYLYKRALMRFSPYYEEKLLNSEKYAQYAYFGSIFFLYLFEDNPYRWLKYVCLLVAIVLNLFVITYIVFHIWKVSKQQVEKGFFKVANAIKKMATTVSGKSFKRTLTHESNFSEEVSRTSSFQSKQGGMDDYTLKTIETLESKSNSIATNNVLLNQDTDMHEEPEIDGLPSKKNTMIEMAHQL